MTHIRGIGGVGRRAKASTRACVRHLDASSRGRAAPTLATVHELVTVTHSWLRWIVLGLGLGVIFACGSGWARGRPWTRTHALAVRLWLGSFAAQVVLGLLLYFFLSPTVEAAVRMGAAAMKNGLLRFWRIEHPITMLLALGVLHLGRWRARRRVDDRGKHAWTAASSAIAMALVCVAIPWPPRKHGRPALRVAATARMVGGCEAPRSNEALPERLSETGLEAAEPYAPRFELWSDGAEKRRFIALPPGASIDTRDPDAWQFPEGTKIWKEFARDGKKLETRVLWKTGAGAEDWAMMAYAWDDEERDAIAVPEGRADVRGTDHDIPSASDCMACHGGAPSRVLGFSALQLAHDGDGVTLSSLADRLSEPVVVPALPGDESSARALGTLHANCGHCHNARQGRAGQQRCFDPRTPFDFYLRVSELDRVESTATWRTAMGSAIVPGDPDASAVIRRMRHRGGFMPGMPPLATEHVDEAGLAAITAWIESL
jgi:hypothetical protein